MVNFDALKKEYSWKQFMREFKQTSDRATFSIPLFSKYIFFVKFIMYVTSYFTKHVNELFWLDPQKVLFSFQIWRLFTAPLITLHFLPTFYVYLPCYTFLVL